MQQALTEAFVARYGVTYSDVDCDYLIEALDYSGQDSLTLDDADKWMAEAGYPPLTRTKETPHD